MPTAIPQNFHATKFCCSKVTWSKLTTEFTEDKTENAIWNKFYLEVCNRKSKPASDSKTYIQNLFVKNLKQEVNLQGQKVCRRILCYVCMYKYFSYKKGCFLRTIIPQTIFFLLFSFRFFFFFWAKRDYWNKMKSLIITN